MKTKNDLIMRSYGMTENEYEIYETNFNKKKHLRTMINTHFYGDDSLWYVFCWLPQHCCSNFEQQLLFNATHTHWCVLNNVHFLHISNMIFVLFSCIFWSFSMHISIHILPFFVHENTRPATEYPIWLPNLHWIRFVYRWMSYNERFFPNRNFEQYVQRWLWQYGGCNLSSKMCAKCSLDKNRLCTILFFEVFKNGNSETCLI